MSRKCVALVESETRDGPEKHVGGTLIAFYDYGILLLFCREHVYNNMMIFGWRKKTIRPTHVPVAAIVDKTRRLKPMTIVVNFLLFFFSHPRRVSSSLFVVSYSMTHTRRSRRDVQFYYYANAT